MGELFLNGTSAHHQRPLRAMFHTI